MSQENVELVRRQNEAFNRGGDGWLEFYDPGAEVHIPPGGFEDHDLIYTGHEGIKRAAALWTENVSEYRWDLVKLIDAGDSVVGLYRFRSRMTESGAWLEPPLGAIFDLRDGKIVRLLTYFSWDEALKGAGLEE